MPLTYPKAPNSHTCYDHKPLESAFGNNYDYLFEFGHGLSYTEFKYSNLTLSTEKLTSPNSLTVSVVVTNIGKLKGKHSVILYLNDEFGSVSRPVRQVRGFTKIELASQERQTVTFTLTINDLTFINQQNRRVFEAGRFFVYIGDQKASFTLDEPGTDNTQTTAQPQSNILEIITEITNLLELNKTTSIKIIDETIDQFTRLFLKTLQSQFSASNAISTWRFILF
jgi:beta-glucosidase